MSKNIRGSKEVMANARKEWETLKERIVEAMLETHAVLNECVGLGYIPEKLEDYLGTALWNYNAFCVEMDDYVIDDEHGVIKKDILEGVRKKLEAKGYKKLDPPL